MGAPKLEGPKRVDIEFWFMWMVAGWIVSSALFVWLWPNCWVAWMAGYAAAAAIAYLLCRILYRGPFDIPVGDPDITGRGPRKFRLLDCDPEKHLKKIKVRYKIDPQAPTNWHPPEPIEIPIEPPVHPFEHWDWEPPSTMPDIFGIWIRVEVDGEWTEPIEHEQDTPMHECTVRVDAGLQVSIYPDRILRSC